MSTIKVNRIENTSTTDGGVSIDVDGHVTIDGQQLPTAGPLSNRNLIINGAMQVAQRTTAELNNVSSSAGLTYQTLDRWGYWSNASNLFSSNQVEDGPEGFYNSVQLKSLNNASIISGSYNTWSQRFEAQDLYRTDIGTATAKDLIASFWVKGSNTGTYSFYILNSSFNYCFVSTYTIDAADTWEYKTISIPGPTTNFTGTGNGLQMEIGFTLGAGTTYSTSTLNQWQSGNFLINASGATNLIETLNATLNITGVQLEVGSKATPFEHESYGQTLAKCQRYCYRVDGSANGYLCSIAGYDGNQAIGTLVFPVTMRNPPTQLITTGTAADYGVVMGNTISNSTSVPVMNSATNNSSGINFFAAGDCTIGKAGHGRLISSSAYLVFHGASEL